MLSEPPSTDDQNNSKMRWIVPTNEEIFKTMVLKQFPADMSVEKLIRIVCEHMIRTGLRDRIVKEVLDDKVGKNMEPVLSKEGNKIF